MVVHGITRSVATAPSTTTTTTTFTSHPSEIDIHDWVWISILLLLLAVHSITPRHALQRHHPLAVLCHRHGPQHVRSVTHRTLHVAHRQPNDLQVPVTPTVLHARPAAASCSYRHWDHAQPHAVGLRLVVVLEVAERCQDEVALFPCWVPSAPHVQQALQPLLFCEQTTSGCCPKERRRRAAFASGASPFRNIRVVQCIG